MIAAHSTAHWANKRRICAPCDQIPNLGAVGSNPAGCTNFLIKNNALNAMWRVGHVGESGTTRQRAAYYGTLMAHFAAH